MKLALALALGVAVLSPAERADAHFVYSTFNNISSSPFFFFHTSPNLSAWTYVGYLSSGFYNGTTNSYAGTSGASYWIQPTNKCTNGFFATASAVRVTYLNQRVSAPTCSSYGWGFLSQGSVAISE